MANKKFYWLKLKEDFFRDKRIKKLRRIAGGDTYTVIYLKLQLLSLKNNGMLIYEGIEDTFAEEMALDIDEDVDNVKITLAFLQANGLLDETDQDHYVMTETIQCIGSESASAERVRKHRERKEQGQLPTEPKQLETPKTNAQRQRMFRAKKVCEEQQHIPLIEDYINNKRYSGNYYLVLKRDAFKCALCGSIENLCMHHIDGYDENKPENNNENKMITLCRHCHSNIHAGVPIPKVILESINYYEDNVTLLGNTQVTIGNIEIEKEKELEKEIEIELEEDKKPTEGKRPPTTKRFTPPTLEEVKNYCKERNNNVDAERFIDYYTSNGWKVGKNSMKDWKAAIRTWERSNTKETTKKSEFSDISKKVREQNKNVTFEYNEEELNF